ncbi:zincin [Cladorrhinum sp. PSN259]|nr:zincin [Cladorrhinum sp. PSN259]
MEHDATCTTDHEDASGYRCLFVPPQLVSAITQNAVSDDNNNVSMEAIVQLQTFNSISGKSEVSEERSDKEEISIQLARAAEENPRSKDSSPGKHRQIYDLQFCKRPSAFPGVLVRSEGDPPVKDPAVNALYDAMGVVYDFFSTKFHDNNIFRTYTPPVGIVHFDFYFPGAFFHLPYTPSDPSSSNKHTAIICGDGWDNDPWNAGAALKTFGGCFGNFAGSLEVVAHEMIHGFLHAVCGLRLDGEPGVVNEHLADVFGIMCEQFHKNQTVSEADWLIGEDLIAPDWKGVAFRSFKSPGTAYKLSGKPYFVQNGDDMQVAHMDKYYKGEEDYGGVHINSGILNKAFYLVASRLAGRGEKYKNSWDGAGSIWYKALTMDSPVPMAPDCDVKMWAQRTYSAAKRQLKLEKDVVQVVVDAWSEVGIAVIV